MHSATNLIAFLLLTALTMSPARAADDGSNIKNEIKKVDGGKDKIFINSDITLKALFFSYYWSAGDLDGGSTYYVGVSCYEEVPLKKNTLIGIKSFEYESKPTKRGYYLATLEMDNECALSVGRKELEINNKADIKRVLSYLNKQIFELKESSESNLSAEIPSKLEKESKEYEAKRRELQAKYDQEKKAEKERTESKQKIYLSAVYSYKWKERIEACRKLLRFPDRYNNFESREITKSNWNQGYRSIKENTQCLKKIKIDIDSLSQSMKSSYHLFSNQEKQKINQGILEINMIYLNSKKFSAWTINEELEQINKSKEMWKAIDDAKAIAAKETTKWLKDVAESFEQTAQAMQAETDRMFPPPPNPYQYIADSSSEKDEIIDSNESKKMTPRRNNASIVFPSVNSATGNQERSKLKDPVNTVYTPTEIEKILINEKKDNEKKYCSARVYGNKYDITKTIDVSLILDVIDCPTEGVSELKSDAVTFAEANVKHLGLAGVKASAHAYFSSSKSEVEEWRKKWVARDESSNFITTIIPLRGIWRRAQYCWHEYIMDKRVEVCDSHIQKGSVGLTKEMAEAELKKKQEEAELKKKQEEADRKKKEEADRKKKEEEERLAALPKLGGPPNKDGCWIPRRNVSWCLVVTKATTKNGDTRVTYRNDCSWGVYMKFGNEKKDGSWDGGADHLSPGHSTTWSSGNSTGAYRYSFTGSNKSSSDWVCSDKSNDPGAATTWSGQAVSIQ